jgi:hypothetical protein
MEAHHLSLEKMPDERWFFLSIQIAIVQVFDSVSPLPRCLALAVLLL